MANPSELNSLFVRAQTSSGATHPTLNSQPETAEGKLCGFAVAVKEADDNFISKPECPQGTWLGKPLTARVSMVKDINDIDKDPEKISSITHIIHAIGVQNIEEIKRLIPLAHSAGFNVLIPDKGHTMLHFAAESGDLQTLSCLIQCTVDLNLKTAVGVTPLYLATVNRQEDAVRLLVDGGADVCTKTDGFSPLHIAADTGHTGILKILLSGFVNVDLRTDKPDQSTPLLYSASGNHIEAVRELLTAGADATLTTKGGVSPLDYAQDNQNQKMIDMLEQATFRKEK